MVTCNLIELWIVSADQSEASISQVLLQDSPNMNSMEKVSQGLSPEVMYYETLFLLCILFCFLNIGVNMISRILPHCKIQCFEK